ncbi:hypothetical protein HNR06_004607 [Nocardiopsis arvandica]|uniref:Lipoprotein n=1 Tax=Nocardiopsis sinuspersici TaxID=501010 RepID=A0A7Y9XI97_9ACTN|nr:hypothetical protein [Nocardiopsis sinuspersici]NYH55018.1 hypothetical protein [Nocardiopsis sinuspersici]
MHRHIPLFLSLPLLLALTACGPEGTVSVEEPNSTPQGQETPSETPSVSESPSGEPSAGAAPDQAPEGEPSSGVTPEGTPPSGGTPEEAFSESHSVSFPVGAYRHEYEGEADVVYTVAGVSSSGSGRVDFTLEVEVPDLERVLGFGNLEAVCETGAGEVAVESTDPPSEAEAGSHTFPMWCDVAPGTEELRIIIRHGGEEMVFDGPVG